MAGLDALARGNPAIPPAPAASGPATSVLAAGHTVLVIAHRLQTIIAADQVLVLDHGEIVQRGRHD